MGKDDMEYGPYTGGQIPPAVKAVLDFEGKVDGGGVREGQAGEKPNTHFLVKEFLYGLAKVMMHGAKKYAPWNWQRGMKYSDTYSSLQRHLWDWWQREDNDDGPKGSGLPHLWHAGCDLMFLVFYEAHRALYGKFDDRPLKPDMPVNMSGKIIEFEGKTPPTTWEDFEKRNFPDIVEKRSAAEKIKERGGIPLQAECSAHYANTICKCDKLAGHLETHRCDCGRRW